MPRKIALVGTAPGSVRLAPYRDSSWAIWACSPGTYPIISAERVYQSGDAFFELHRWEPPVIGRADLQVPWFTPEYCTWLAQYPGPVWTGEVVDDLPHSQRLPHEKLVDKYSPYFFTSSLAWMLAMALEDPECVEIGLWGVDMSAREEYFYQRPGCQHFIHLAMERGIRVTLPPESDLLFPMPLYAVGEWNPMNVKLLTRKKELEARLAGAQQRAAGAQSEMTFLQGALDDLTYIIETWTGADALRRTPVAPRLPLPDLEIPTGGPRFNVVT